jgi:hypothetical protein
VPPTPSVDDVEEKLKATTLSAGDKDYSMDFKVPYLMWKHTVDQGEHMNVHFYAPNLPNQMFRLRLVPFEVHGVNLVTSRQSSCL